MRLCIDTLSATYDALGRMVELNSSGTYTQTVYGLAGAGGGFSGGWVTDTWSAGGCQDIYSDGNYVGNTCGGRQQQPTQPQTADTNAPTNGTDFKPLFCLGDAFAAKGLDVALDTLGAIPGLGNLVSGSVAGAKVIKTVSGVVSLAR